MTSRAAVTLGRKRWKGVSKAQRSAAMRAAIMKRWHPKTQQVHTIPDNASIRLTLKLKEVLDIAQEEGIIRPDSGWWQLGVTFSRGGDGASYFSSLDLFPLTSQVPTVGSSPEGGRS